MKKYIILCLALALPACSIRHHEKADPNLGPTSMIYSPNGEPLNGDALGRPTCVAALGNWFDRVNSSHSGNLTRDEFIADVKAQFTRMDIDHNGYLLPEELERYRFPFRQDTTPPARKNTDKDAKNKSTRRGHHGVGEAKVENDHEEGDGETVMLDPVMAADTNNDLRITPEKFMVQAEKNFTVLDAEHQGFITRETLLKTCEKMGKR